MTRLSRSRPPVGYPSARPYGSPSAGRRRRAAEADDDGAWGQQADQPLAVHGGAAKSSEEVHGPVRLTHGYGRTSKKASSMTNRAAISAGGSSRHALSPWYW